MSAAPSSIPSSSSSSSDVDASSSPSSSTPSSPSSPSSSSSCTPFDTAEMTFEIWSYLCLAEWIICACVSRRWSHLIYGDENSSESYSSSSSSSSCYLASSHVTSLTFHQSATGHPQLCDLGKIDNHYFDLIISYHILPHRIPLHHRCPPRHILNHILTTCTRLHTLHFIRCEREDECNSAPVSAIPLQLTSSLLLHVILSGCIDDVDVMHLSSAKRIQTLRFTSASHRMDDSKNQIHITHDMWMTLATSFNTLITLELNGIFYLQDDMYDIFQTFIRHNHMTLQSFTCQWYTIPVIHDLLITCPSLHTIHLENTHLETPDDQHVLETWKHSLQQQQQQQQQQRQQQLQSAFRVHPLHTCVGVISSWCDDEIFSLLQLPHRYPLITALDMDSDMMTHPHPPLILSQLPLQQLSLCSSMRRCRMDVTQLLPSLSLITHLTLHHINITHEILAGLSSWTPILCDLQVIWRRGDVRANPHPQRVIPESWNALSACHHLTHLTIEISDGGFGPDDTYTPLVTLTSLAGITSLTHLCLHAEDCSPQMWNESDLQQWCHTSTSSYQQLELNLPLEMIPILSQCITDATCTCFHSLRTVKLFYNDSLMSDTMYDILISHPILPLHSLTVGSFRLNVSRLCHLLRVHPLLNELNLGDWDYSPDEKQSFHDMQMIWDIRPDIQMRWKSYQ